jgi:NAD(P)-dependent dehydrogenase (short-subunit alcohol dehydrogenase family)
MYPAEPKLFYCNIKASDLNVKNIFITGVSTGIGYCTTNHFLKLGYRVFCSVRKPEDKLRLEQEFDRSFPEQLVVLLFDVTDECQVATAVEKTKKILKEQSLIALVNNAGYAQAGPMALLPDKVFRQQIEVNLFGVRNVTNALLPLLGASKAFTGKPGKIINISSISGVFNTPMNGSYCVAKHALESLGEVYRRELSMYGIQVCSIQPGPIESKLWDKNNNAFDEYLTTDYGYMAKKSASIVESAQKDALPAFVIAKLIENIIIRKRPRRSYIVTKNKVINILIVKYTPTFMIDYFFHRYFSTNR